MRVDRRKRAPRLPSAAAAPTFTPPAAAPVPAARPHALAGRPVLVAVDGTPASEPAIRLALALAERRGAAVQVIHVVDTRPAPLPPPLDIAVGITGGKQGGKVQAEQEVLVRAALARVAGHAVDWPVRVTLGTPARAIVEEARRQGAALLLLGLHPIGAVEHLVHAETTLQVMRTAPCPVVGVTPTLQGLPTRVLVGIDFSRASVGAARVARTLVADGGTLLLGYVPPPWGYMPDDGEQAIHELGVERAFELLEGELSGPGGIGLVRAILRRDPVRTVARVLLDYAVGAQAQMIAVASMRHGRVERWMLGSVTSDVAHDGSCAMLVIPPGENA